MGEREIAEEALLKEGSRNVYKKDLNFGTTRNGSTMKYLTRELLAAFQTMKNKKKILENYVPSNIERNLLITEFLKGTFRTGVK